MIRDLILINLEKAVLLDEEITMMMEKVEYEKTIISDMTALNVNVLNEILRLLESEKEKVNAFFGAINYDMLNEVYEILFVSQDDVLKAAKLEYLFMLMDNLEEKEMVR